MRQVAADTVQVKRRGDVAAKTLPWRRSTSDAYACLRGSGAASIFLDSALVGDRSRYSIIGFDPVLTLKADSGGARLETEGGKHSFADALAFLAGTVGKTTLAPVPGVPFPAGFAGIISYDFARSLERVGNGARDDLRTPWLDLHLFDATATIDRLSHTVTVCAADLPGFSTKPKEERLEGALARLALRGETGRFAAGAGAKPNLSRKGFEDMVLKAQDRIREGEIFQANLSVRFESQAEGDPLTLFDRLAALNPSSFAGVFESSDQAIVSASPERLLKLEGDRLETRPIAGTRPRGEDQEKDAGLVGELLASPKERAEHVMLVDLERNDLGRIAQFGSVRVEDFMAVEQYSHVSHIVSSVVARKRRDVDVAGVLRAMFPGGTITGAPKIRAMEVIDSLEPTRRGPYTGAMGYFSLTGDIDLNILIRSVLLKDGAAFVQAGAGIVADSEARREYDESMAKARASLSALGATL
ncbi:MAG: anthranilate synthase component I family protein [Euryarchaeota archaeon]|nr:anthranilate synthase component I family protein [Euryarchaeota archaeon]